MSSGFFLISKYQYGLGKWKVFYKKTAKLYLFSIFLYLPVNYYAGYFKMNQLAPNLIKDILFDGTFYHLWYLPASMIGAGIAWHLVKKLDYGKALSVAVLLYLIGLFGDSYYGFAAENPWISGIYGLVFQLSDYTRNGIFFAPVFFVMGGLFADKKQKLHIWKSFCGFGISFAFLCIEALLLRFFQLQRHDSMYLCLLPCMYFLFQMLLQFTGKRHTNARTFSLVLYLIHPLMILAVRVVAKIVKQQELWIENSLAHFCMVSFVSAAAAFFITLLWNKIKPQKKRMAPEWDRACVEINLKNLEHNARTLQRAMPPGCKLMAVVKADAYGHGAYAVSVHLNRIGVKSFAVATLEEGIRLREYGISGEILILGYTAVSRAAELKKYDFMQTILDFAYARALNRQKIRVKVHIKIDTGMRRLGIDADDASDVKRIFQMKYLDICGMYTHFSCAESRNAEDIAYTKRQAKRFYSLAEELKNSGIELPKLHLQSSYGFLNYPELAGSYVRAGIALYGVKSAPNDNTALKLDLRPALTLKSHIILIRAIKKGEFAGYGRSFQAGRDSLIGILPIGYGDGFPRSLSCGVGTVWIRDMDAPIVGRVCMDQLAVDVTKIENVAVGDEAILIGAKNTAEQAPVVAAKSGSISNELLCRIGARLPRNI